MGMQRRVGLVCVVLLLTACKAKPVSSPAHMAEIAAWHAERLKKLQAEDGWLTLVGLHWLQPGRVRVGAAADNDIVLPKDRAPEHLGTLDLDQQGGHFVVAPGGLVTHDGAPVTEIALRSDAEGTVQPTVLRHGSLSFHLISRGQARALRVRDQDSPVRRDFSGIETYPADDKWRIEARFEPYDPPHEIVVPTGVGTMEKQKSPGAVVFSVNDVPGRLDVVQEPDSDALFIVFGDATNGKDTYGTGRFLYAKPPRDGRVTLDFNKAYNPPCAFTPYATCPLPPPQNRLALKVEAGEKKVAHH